MIGHNVAPLPLDGEGVGGWGDPSIDPEIAKCAPSPVTPHPPTPSPQGRRRTAESRAKRLRATLTKAETLFWKLLRRYPPAGSHWRRQVAVGGLVFDFGCHAIRTLIELDGDIHKLPDVKERDIRKAAVAAQHGYRLVRIANDDVQADETAAFLAALTNTSLAPSPVTPIPQPLPHAGGRGEKPDAPTSA